MLLWKFAQFNAKLDPMFSVFIVGKNSPILNVTDFSIFPKFSKRHSSASRLDVENRFLKKQVTVEVRVGNKLVIQKWGDVPKHRLPQQIRL